MTAWTNQVPGADKAVCYTGNKDNQTSADYNTNAPTHVAGPHGVPVLNFDGSGYRR